MTLSVKRPEYRNGPDGRAYDMHKSDEFRAWELAWASHFGVTPDAPIEVERGSSSGGGTGDPEAKVQHAEAMSYVRSYTGSWGLVLDIRANPRFGMPSFRLSPRQVEVLLAGKARDAARSAEAEVRSDIFHDDEYRQWIASPVVAAPVVRSVEPVTEGMYLLPDGTIAKVQKAVHGSGNLYAKRLAVGDGEGSFEYAPGLIRQLRAEYRMTAEQAADFGHLYGFCCVCGRTLTDERSIAAGIGPVCGRRV